MKPSLRLAFAILAPLALLAGLILIVLRTGPADALKPAGAPPVERLAIGRVELTPNGMIVHVLNDGPDQVAIAQVQVDNAYWRFEADSGTVLSHLARTALRIPYPWVAGEAHRVRIVTSSGATFEREIPVAVETPRPSVHFVAVFALIGLYVGVIPVAIGILWFPLLKTISERAFDFLLALTIGLLLFLIVDATAEGFEVAGALPQSYQGVALFVLAAVAAFLGLSSLGRWLKERRGTRPEDAAGAVLALLIAVGIGLHNLGEGLAIGAAFALGQTVLGSLLIVGFTLHNTTEGIAIVAPLARRRAATPGGRVAPLQLVGLGAIGGIPTIAGALLGGFVYSPVWSLFFLGFGVGAIAQVVVQILGQMARNEPLVASLTSRPVIAGLFAGFVAMYATGLLIG